MADASPGPRDYTAATERALYAFARTTCYYPSCPTPVIVFVDDDPVCNVEIAHIRGANPGSPRFDQSMTNDERRAFANLVLLCKPHHEVVDKRRPDEFSVELLASWKAQRESEAGVDDTALATISDDLLSRMIEKAVAAVGPQRKLTVELGIGIGNARGCLVLPVKTAVQFFDMYKDLGRPIFALTVHSEGALKAFVDGHAIAFHPNGGKLLGTQGLPVIGPRLPYPVDVGESVTWHYDFGQVVGLMDAMAAASKREIEALAGEVRLGSGETIASALVPVEYLRRDR